MSYDVTKSRMLQWVGILILLGVFAGAYWYFSVRAGVKSNTATSQPQGVGNLSSGLAGYWAMDNGSGTSATDSSTNGNTGTLTAGPTWTTGQIGSAVNFDGTDDYIDAGTAGLTSPSKLSGAAWVKVDDIAFGERYTIFSNRSSGNNGWSLTIEANGTCSGLDCGQLRFTIQNVDSYTTTADWVPETQWTHVAFIWDGANVSFYVNGVKVQTISTGSMTTGSNLLLGAHGPSPGLAGFFMDGLIDEARVYDRVLSSDEMSQLYRLTTPTGVDTSLKGYWSFNGQDISGTTAYDRSGAGNNGTLTNSPAIAEGVAGQALSFNGTNQTASTGNSIFSTSDASQAYTINAWVKTTDTNGNIVEQWAGGANRFIFGVYTGDMCIGLKTALVELLRV